nr:hypothetical protein [uncultured Pedobacter sp.]
MSNWKTKSESSLKAAESLCDNFSNQSVHCSYYSCVQFIYHIFNDSLNEPKDNLEKGGTKRTFELSLKDKEGKIPTLGTHEWLHQELFRSLRSRDNEDAEEIFTDLVTLSGVRVIADYKSEIVLPSRAKGIYKKAVELIDTLKKEY